MMYFEAKKLFFAALYFQNRKDFRALKYLSLEFFLLNIFSFKTTRPILRDTRTKSIKHPPIYHISNLETKLNQRFSLGNAHTIFKSIFHPATCRCSLQAQHFFIKDGTINLGFLRQLYSSEWSRPATKQQKCLFALLWDPTNKYAWHECGWITSFRNRWFLSNERTLCYLNTMSVFNGRRFFWKTMKKETVSWVRIHFVQWINFVLPTNATLLINISQPKVHMDGCFDRLVYYNLHNPIML